MSNAAIRQARPGDAADLAALVDIAGEGLPALLWQERAGEGESPFEIGRARARREEGGFSYRNSQMIDAGGETAGCLVSYLLEPDGGDLSDAPTLVQGLLELEALVVGHWYVNILGVYPEFRGQGLGTRLLDHADRLGRDAGSDGIALIVASGNLSAHRLYRRWGYREVARKRALDYPGGRRGQEWLLMAKPHG